MSVQPPSSQVAVVSDSENDQESELKVRVRSDVLQKSAKRSGRQSQVKIIPGFPMDDKEVGTTTINVCDMSTIDTTFILLH